MYFTLGSLFGAWQKWNDPKLGGIRDRVEFLWSCFHLGTILQKVVVYDSYFLEDGLPPSPFV